MLICLLISIVLACRKILKVHLFPLQLYLDPAERMGILSKSNAILRYYGDLITVTLNHCQALILLIMGSRLHKRGQPCYEQGSEE